MDFIFTGSAYEEENIWTAASDGDVARVQQLLAEGVAVNAQDDTGYSPIHAASSYNQIALLNVLLANGADVNLRDADGDTPLLVCESPEVFRVLVAAGADPAARNKAGQGILEKAFDDENETLILFLMQNGYVTDPNFKFTPGDFEMNTFEEGAQGEEDDEEEDAEDAEGGQSSDAEK